MIEKQVGLASGKPRKMIPSWVWFYLGALIFLLVWGAVVAWWLPIVEANAGPPDLIELERYAPGWASRGIFRAVLAPWLRWDTVWYLSIARDGYLFNLPGVAFPPLYPLLIRLVGQTLGGQYLIGALLVSWTACFGACALLVERVQHQWAEIAPSRVIRTMLFFPTAFFLFAGYTESLFLLLALVGWRLAEDGKWQLVGWVGALAILTRFVGVFLFIPYGLIWWQQYRAGEKKLFSVLWLLPMPAAYLGWGTYAGIVYGMKPADALLLGWTLHMDWPWVGIIGSLKVIFTRPVSIAFYAYIDLLAVIMVALSVIWWQRRRGYAETLFMLAVLLVSLIKISDIGMLGSTARYLMILFPLYLSQPKWFTHPMWGRVVLYGSILLWMFSSAMFFTWNWIG